MRGRCLRKMAYAASAMISGLRHLRSSSASPTANSIAAVAMPTRGHKALNAMLRFEIPPPCRARSSTLHIWKWCRRHALRTSADPGLIGGERVSTCALGERRRWGIAARAVAKLPRALTSSIRSHRFILGLLDRGSRDGRGVVDHDIDPAEPLRRPGDRRSHGCVVAHVDDQRQRLPARRLDLGSGGVDRTGEMPVAPPRSSPRSRHWRQSRAARSPIASPIPRLPPVMNNVRP